MNDIDITGYRIEKEIGHGGMATVYLAVQQSLGRHVALKVMAPALAADRTFCERFLKEARTVAQLSHAHILAIHDVGIGGHRPYIAVEYVAGGDLKQRIAAGMGPREALAVLEQMAKALTHAHGKGFVHRDIKPENILFREDGSAVLTDFGIAKAIGAGIQMTRTGMSIGTPHYMSPEQARGEPVDGRSDLYSLGVVFHEMLTGSVPYTAADTFAVALKHINEPVPVLPSPLTGLQPLIDGMMAKNPAHRYADADALLSAVTASGKGDPLPVPAHARTPAATRVLPTAGATPHPAPPSTGAGLKWALGGALTALLIGVAVYALWFTPQSGPSQPMGAGAAVAVPISTGAPAAGPAAGTADGKITQAAAPLPPPEPLSADYGALFLTSVPEGAEVFIGGAVQGTTPLELQRIAAGAHNVVFKMPYHDPLQTRIVVDKDIVVKEHVVLQRGRGNITIFSSPGRLPVLLNGRPQPEKTPLTISNVASGRHTLSLAHEGHYDVEVEVEVLPGRTVRKEIALQPWGQTRLFVETDPSGAGVRIMNIPEPFAQGMALDPGKYQVRVDADHHVAREQWVTVAGEEERRLPLKLTPMGIIQVTGGPAGAAVYLGDKRVGTLPCTLEGVPDGTHTLRVEKAGYVTAGHTVAAKAGTVTKVDIRMITVVEQRQERYAAAMAAGSTAAEKWDRQEAVTAFEAALQSKPGDAAAQAALDQARAIPVKGDRFTNSLGMEFVFIPPGSFDMGSPASEEGRIGHERQHRVTLTQGFWMQTTEVTQAQWRAVMGNNPSRFQFGDTSPVERVSWNDTQDFIRKLDAQEGKAYRLPTEAQWEYAARAGTQSRWSFGNDEHQLGAHAWFSGNSAGRTHSVGRKRPNAWGLYDMHGNVWEWCQDWYGAYPSDAVTDPTGPASGTYRVIRGGSWSSDPGNSRSGNRFWRTPAPPAARRTAAMGYGPPIRDGYVGFRLVLPPVR